MKKIMWFIKLVRSYFSAIAGIEIDRNNFSNCPKKYWDDWVKYLARGATFPILLIVLIFIFLQSYAYYKEAFGLPDFHRIWFVEDKKEEMSELTLLEQNLEKADALKEIYHQQVKTLTDVNEVLTEDVVRATNLIVALKGDYSGLKEKLIALQSNYDQLIEKELNSKIRMAERAKRHTKLRTQMNRAINDINAILDK